MRRLANLLVPGDDAGRRMGCHRSERHIRGLSFAARCLSTTAIVTVMAAPINYVHAKPPCKLPGYTEICPPPLIDAVSLQGMEVTQAIQDIDNNVPLVAGKTTWVRVYLSSGKSGGVIATLRAARSDGSVIWIPAGAAVSVSDTLTSQRMNWTKSLNFPLPDSVTATGRVTFQLVSMANTDPDNTSISCDNCDSPTPVTFTSEPPLRVRAIGIHYNYGSPPKPADPDPIDYALLKSWLGRAYPVSRVEFTNWPATGPRKAWPFTCGDANALVAAIQGDEVGNPNSVTVIDPRTHYYGLVSDHGGFMRGCASDIPSKPDPSVVASGPTGPNWSDDKDGSYGDWYGGHELAHTLGRYHAPGRNAKGEDCGAGGPDPLFPYPDGRIGEAINGDVNYTGHVGLDVGDSANEIPLRVLWPKTTFDIMNYCPQPQWLSDYNYKGVRQRLLDENKGFQPVLLAGAFRAAGDRMEPVSIVLPPQVDLLTGPMVHVVASVNLTRGTGAIEYVFPVQRAARQVGPTDRAALVVRDGSGRQLSQTPVVLRESTDIPPGEDQTGLMYAAVPFNPAMAEIDLVLDHKVLARYSNATTALRAPSGLQVLSAIGGTGPILTWMPPVGTAGAVTYTVQTSDDGNAWSTIAIGLEEPSLTLTPEMAGALMARVIAGNGFRSAAPVMVKLRQ
jgi:hypothetical protein